MEDQSNRSAKREEIRSRVARSKAALDRPRLPEASPPDGVRSLAMDYPFALVFGGLALGLVVGSFIPRVAGRKLVRGALTAATIAGDLGLAYSRQAAEKTGDAAGSARDSGLKLARRIGKLSSRLRP